MRDRFAAQLCQIALRSKAGTTMEALNVSVQVSISAPKGGETLRVAGFTDDSERISIATMEPGSNAGTHELTFTLGQALEIAEHCLAGNPRALTTPGLARILSATVALLFRVSMAAGAITTVRGDEHGDGHRQD